MAALRHAALLLGAFCSGGEVLAQSFYDIDPSELSGPPGSVIRYEGMGSAVKDAAVYRILYRSTGLKGESIAVSGVVVVPLGPPPQQGRDVVAWAHPTTGVRRDCAPSMWPAAHGTIPGVWDMIRRGWVVVATDYPGLGTRGTHPYLIGESEGRAVLDSVRAAGNMAATGATNRFVVWGHSQGGHAALFAGELARHYARDLRLLGVAAAAPATELGPNLISDIETTSGKILAGYALWAWTRIFDVPIESVLVPSAIGPYARIAGDCIETLAEMISIGLAERPLRRTEVLKVDITEVEPWRTLLRRNSAGGAPPGAPLFIAQGTADPVVRPQITAKFVQTACRYGVQVRFLRVPGADHSSITRASASAMVRWAMDRFRGAPAPDDCR